MALFGVVIALTPFGVDLEQNFGLDVLFKVRGERQPSQDVVVVAIDRASTNEMGLPTQLDRWPRSYHAKLVDVLTEMGAQAIAFDVLFSEARQYDSDSEFSQALKRASNTVLIANMSRQRQSFVADVDQLVAGVSIEQWTPPIPMFADSALAIAPFVLPKVPAQVRQYWTFKQFDELVPALPATMLQIYALQVYDDWLALLTQIDSGFAGQLPQSVDQLRAERKLVRLMKHFQEYMSARPELGQRLLAALDQSSLDSKTKRILKALIQMYSGDTNHYVNFYGGPRTIMTIPYHKLMNVSAMQDLSEHIKGKAVFVGISEKRIQEQEDGFVTVFSQADGSDLSGVEIGATAFSNLLNDDAIKTLSPLTYLFLILVWGAFIGVICSLFNTAIALLVSGLFCIAYFLGAYYGFTAHNLWLPLVIPLFFQAPLTVFIAVFGRYRESSRQRNSLQKAFSYYVPADVVKRFASDNNPASAERQLVMGTCMFTDAEQYTSLAEKEKDSPEKVAVLMNDYYESLFGPIRQQDGIISDVVGDAVLALWFAPEDSPDLSLKACHAALAITRQATQGDKIKLGQLPTRIGLHHGPISVGNVGAGDHFEYRAVGDTVNTSTRVEGLNKLLGTRVLASEAVINNAPGILSRKLGRFVLVGKSQALIIYEILDEKNREETVASQQYLSDFDEALAQFYAQQWQAALLSFSALLHKQPQDGPAQYYHRLSQQFVQQPRVEWSGAVMLKQK